ncbi:hypothetical protein CEXT_132461 [Caerostris extrusa]|uniref:Uncharacterized protein n=1 Tax=Caerostris extrusa TaxID=172846 RepID=A0AAV4XT55_CAEEX|nr:hypothetical protein CEXT_132461 [Caerostris extrusa]
MANSDWVSLLNECAEDLARSKSKNSSSDYNAENERSKQPSLQNGTSLRPKSRNSGCAFNLENPSNGNSNQPALLNGNNIRPKANTIIMLTVQKIIPTRTANTLFHRMEQTFDQKAETVAGSTVQKIFPKTAAIPLSHKMQHKFHQIAEVVAVYTIQKNFSLEQLTTKTQNSSSAYIPDNHSVEVNYRPLLQKESKSNINDTISLTKYSIVILNFKGNLSSATLDRNPECSVRIHVPCAIPSESATEDIDSAWKLLALNNEVENLRKDLEHAKLTISILQEDERRLKNR